MREEKKKRTSEQEEERRSGEDGGREGCAITYARLEYARRRQCGEKERKKKKEENGEREMFELEARRLEKETGLVGCGTRTVKFRGGTREPYVNRRRCVEDQERKSNTGKQA